MGHDTNAVEATGLVKRFGKTTALDGVDLVARQGRVLGVLGPNGAGKTTAVRILATLLTADAGQARVCGYDVVREAHQVRQLIGLTGQYASVDEGLSGTNNLVMIGRLLGLGRADAKARAAELLARFGLTDAAGRPAKTYSGGMRRRLDLAASMVGQPRVLYLDEPTTGLDPRSRTDVWQMVRGMVADGVTVLLTTHYLEEAQELCDRIAIINNGKVIACEPTRTLLGRIDAKELLLTLSADLAQVPASLARFQPELIGARRLRLHYQPNQIPVAVILAAVRDAGLEIADLSTVETDLEDIFLQLTRRPAGTVA